MSELLLLLGQRTRVQLLREQKRLWAVRNYSEVIRRSAQAVRLVADDRDAYVYYRVGEELGLDWDFSDPEKTCDLAHRLDRIACAFCSRPRHVISGAAVSCASKALAEQAGANKELEQIVLWLSDVWGSLQHEENLLRNCADLLDAAGAVVDYQLLFGVSMEVAVVCGDGSVLHSLASRLGELADAVANAGAARDP